MLKNVLPIIERSKTPSSSLRQVAAELNARGVQTARGGKWYATTVHNILTFDCNFKYEEASFSEDGDYLEPEAHRSKRNPEMR